MGGQKAKEQTESGRTRARDDRALLEELLRSDLSDEEHAAFANMLDRITREQRFMRGVPVLSQAQRAWAEDVAGRLGVSFARDNSAVPVGAPVETPAVLRVLPKRPPQRRSSC